MEDPGIRTSEERYRTLFATMAQGVVYQAADGRVVEANPAVERILGLATEELHGRSFPDSRLRAIRADGSDFPGDEYPSAVALRTGTAVRNVLMGVFNARENAYRWIVIHAVPRFRAGDKRPCDVYTTIEDVTERRQFEEERLRLERRMQEAQRLESLGVLAGGVAHDFNNLLMGIVGNTELVLDARALTEEDRTCLHEILRASRRAADLCLIDAPIGSSAATALEALAIGDLPS